jgi:CRP-like cAMP-binding protein
MEAARFEQLLAADRSLARRCIPGRDAGKYGDPAGMDDQSRPRLAHERVAHLLCEIFERLRTVGLVEGKSCAFPITQMDPADATGLSVVHINRTIQELRAGNLIVLRERTLTINDLDALKNLALSSPSYLHLRAE